MAKALRILTLSASLGRVVCLVLLCLVLLAGPRPLAAGPDDAPPPEITRGELKGLVKKFASDKMEGRESGTPQCDKAAEMIAAEFERLGFEPLGGTAKDGQPSYFQDFTSPKGTKVLKTSAFAVTDAKGKTTAFKLAVDFTPIDISAQGDVKGEAVFAGYGISAPGLGSDGYDDYAGLDVKGKIVVVLRHAPRYEDKRKSPFAARGVMLKHGTFKAKADAASAKGALALVVVNDPASFGKKSDDKLRLPGGSKTGKIPVMHMTWQAGKRLGRRLGVPFVRRQRAIDAKFVPRSEACPGVTLHVFADVVPDVRQMKNVVGLLKPGAKAVTTGDATATASSETLVIGAHYDHVGWGHFGSLANAGGKIHNGADDNASGTTSLLEIAGLMASRREELKRPILFIAFCGEELGLLGSKHYVREPRVPLAQCVAMLNLDMVGRLEKNRLFVGGTGTSPVWPEMMERLNKSKIGRFDLTSWPGGKAPSDHASFYEANMPVLFFFTGLHGDYHRPSDDPKTLNYKGLERIGRFAAAVAVELCNRDARPQFTRCDAGGFTVGPYTGIAVEQRDDGVYVAHVDKRSPASKAGFKVGDKILEWNKAAIPNTNRYNDLVSKAKPSDKVEVVIERKGKRSTRRIKLGRT